MLSDKLWLAVLCEVWRNVTFCGEPALGFEAKRKELTMAKDMLGIVVRKLVMLPVEVLGLVYDLLEKLADPVWVGALKNFLRKEPCWVEKIGTHLRQCFTFKLGATDGKDTYDIARNVFRGHFDSKFARLGVVFSGIAPETEIDCGELVRRGTFSEIFGDTAEKLERRRLHGSQFLAISRDGLYKLIDNRYFVLTREDEKVAEDMSNVSIAVVDVNGMGELRAYLYEFQGNMVRDSYMRVFSPLQAQ